MSEIQRISEHTQKHLVFDEFVSFAIRGKMDPKDLVLEETTEELFEKFKAWWHREAWKNKDAILLRITKPIIPNSWKELFSSFLEHKYADEAGVISNDVWRKGYARVLRKYPNKVSEMVEIADNDPACRVEVRYEIKPPRWVGRQSRARIGFELYQGRIISTQVGTDPDEEGKISQLFIICPPSISGNPGPYHALWVPDDYTTRRYAPPSTKEKTKAGF